MFLQTIKETFKAPPSPAAFGVPRLQAAAYEGMQREHVPILHSLGRVAHVSGFPLARTVLACEHGPGRRTPAEEPHGWVPAPKEQGFYAFSLNPDPASSLSLGASNLVKSASLEFGVCFFFFVFIFSREIQAKTK